MDNKKTPRSNRKIVNLVILVLAVLFLAYESYRFVKEGFSWLLIAVIVLWVAVAVGSVILLLGGHGDSDSHVDSHGDGDDETK
jgi:di/tricarboxylate transporter